MAQNTQTRPISKHGASTALRAKPVQLNGHGKYLRRRAAGQVLSEGLGLVDSLLLALRVIRVDDSRLGVPRGLTTAEALARARVHLDVARQRPSRRRSRRRSSRRR